MEYGDSKEALFVEPNAYIQNFSKEKTGTKKVVFSEPYETMPNYYINNNFHKKQCEYREKPQQNNCQNPSQNLLFDFKNI
ncbi:MAG: hypothetical protein IKA36_01015, partial [Clostridia bacterium]|nr:hypothetical protein [Clostridia bacterium]